MNCGLMALLVSVGGLGVAVGCGIRTGDVLADFDRNLATFVTMRSAW